MLADKIFEGEKEVKKTWCYVKKNYMFVLVDAVL